MVSKALGTFCVIVLITGSVLLAQQKVTTRNSEPAHLAAVGHFPQGYLIDINKIRMPVSPTGAIGFADISEWCCWGRFENIAFIDGNWDIAGLKNGKFWIQDSIPCFGTADGKGPSSSTFVDPRNGIYVIKSTDTAFSSSWQEWKDAVALGAGFYDGDGNGKYLPADNNKNGRWDLTEDRPDILGNITTWNVSHILSRYSRPPLNLGIDVQQSVFAWDNSHNAALRNAMFYRFRFINRGTLSELYDSLYIMFSIEGDVGNYHDDLAGCDTVENCAYVYQKTADQIFGANPPAFFVKVLQGPQWYEPGKTFLDANGNGRYDPGADSALKTALQMNGPVQGIRKVPGAENSRMSSFMNRVVNPNILTEPPGPYNIYTKNMRGIAIGSENIDPCTYFEGAVAGVNCTAVNPRFYYSGDPLTNSGWVDTFRTEQRLHINVGPFKLERDKPADLIFAVVAARGNSGLQSLSLGRDYCFGIQEHYNDNFGTDIPSSTGMAAVFSYGLSQNYPNPFNASTKIRYTLRTPPPEFSWDKDGMRPVTLKIFDILGREVAMPVNTMQATGEYVVDFNAAEYGLPSGIYIYELRAGVFVDKKKMVYLK